MSARGANLRSASAETLVRTIAPEWLPQGAAAATAAADPFPEAVPLLEVKGTPPALLAERFADRNITLLVADGGAGKTTVCLHLAAALATGSAPFEALPATDPRRVLFVSAEDGAAKLRNRAEAFLVGHGWDVALARANLHVLALEPDVRLDTTLGQAILAANVEAVAAEVIMLDPLADLMEGDDAANRDAKLVAGFLRRLVRDGQTVFVAHHVSKPSEGRGKVHRVRGASAWFNAARAVWWLESEGHGALTMECLKLSDSEKPATIELRLTATLHSDNAANWAHATLKAPGQGGSYAVTHRHTLKPSEHTLLSTLRDAGESLSFSALVARSGLSDNATNTGQRRLADLGLIEKAPTGRRIAARPVYAYSITSLGLAQLAEETR